MQKRYPPRSKSDDADEGADDWLLTYGDLMTQLVCFFVLLMSFSIISNMKFRAAIASLQESLGGTGVLPEYQALVDEVAHVGESEDEMLMELKSTLDMRAEEYRMSAYMETEMRGEGLAIILKQKEPSVFFDTADARIKEEAYPILDQIGQLIKDLPNEIRIEGHTDSRPINTPQFPSNWELSVMRATSVLRYMANAGVRSERLCAAGYGPYKPIASNDTEVGMSKNRRVEIIILRTEKLPEQSDKENLTPES